MLNELQTSDLLDTKAVCRFFGGTERPINRSTLHRGIAAGRFPKPVKIGKATPRWLLPELVAARNKLIAARDDQ
jgi:predicted DNA-binding transcriptional regulator AlpA